MRLKSRKIIFFALFALTYSLMFSVSVQAASSLHAPLRNKDGTVTYSYVYFGSYPQTEVVSSKDSRQLSALKRMNTNYVTKYEKVSPSRWKKIVSAKYNANGDARVGGVKYRRIRKIDATNAYEHPGQYYWTDETTYHYFKYEPIRWRILDKKKNGKVLMVSEDCLDDEKYNDTSSYVMWNIKWKNSTIRSWLNGYAAGKNDCRKNYQKDNFIDSAFSTAQKKKILSGKLEGGVKDKVFLLSEDDIYGNSKAYRHGFIKDSNQQDINRRCTVTTYAFAKGAYRTPDEWGHKGNVWWWLRSPNYGNDVSPTVHYGGDVATDGENMDNDCGGIRPAILISRNTLKTKTSQFQFLSDNYTLKKGKRKKLNIKKKNVKTVGKVIWSTSNKGVVSVSHKGTVTARGAGSAVITASSANGYTAQCRINVSMS